MRTYEKPPASRSRGSNYSGLIAVICLVAAMLATWALTRTSLIPASTVTTGTTTAPSVPANR
jgi:hypothetical protein